MEVDISATMTRAAVHVAMLPPELRAQVQAEEGVRFTAMVDELAAEWTAPGDETRRLQNSLRWVPVVNWCGIRTNYVGSGSARSFVMFPANAS